MPLLDDALAKQADSSLRDALNRALRQLEAAKASKQELVEAVYRAAHDAAVALSYTAVPPPPKRKAARNAEVAVAVLSDWQLGKVTPDYNSEVCEQRIRRYAEKVVELTAIQRADHPINALHVWLLGDLIEGELVFPGQAHRIDGGLYRQVALNGPRILADFLRTMLASFSSVSVTAVIGNHGAIGGPFRKEMAPDTNADRMLYRIVADRLSDEKRLTWTIPDAQGERSWYAIDHIGSYSCLLFHGDQVRGGFAGFPWYGLAKKVWGWKSGAIAEHFDDAAMGHFHTPTRATLNTTTVRVNGSTESQNTYAQEQLAAVGSPSQWLLFVHPDKGIVTAEYLVHLA